MEAWLHYNVVQALAGPDGTSGVSQHSWAALLKFINNLVGTSAVNTYDSYVGTT